MIDTQKERQIKFLTKMIRDRLQKAKAAGVEFPPNFPALMRADAIKLAARYNAQGAAEEIAAAAEKIAEEMMSS